MIPIRSTAVLLTALLTFATSLRAENEGLAELDKATELQGQANSLQDLEEVAKVAEEALKKGLDKDNTAFAKQLIVSALWQHASQLSAAIFEQPRPDPRWTQLRGLIMKDLDKVLTHDDTFVEAHVLVGKLQALPRGNRERALKSVERAVELYTEQKDNKELSKTLLLRAGMRENADDRLADVAKAIEADPDNLDALKLRAAVHIDRGEFDKAIEDFQALLKQDPDSLAVKQAIANTYASQGQFDKAIEFLNETIQAAPDNALTYAMRAEIYERQDKYDEAIADWNKALELQPSNAGALLGRARLHYLKEDLKAAMSDVDRVLQQQPGLGQAVLLKSMIAAADGNFAEAISTLQSVLRSDPTNIDLRLQLASFYVADERPRKAIRVLTQILADDEQNWRAMRARGDALLSVGKHAEAIEDYGKAMKIQPEDDGILNNLAWVLATSPKDDVRDGKRAVELATKACEVTEFKKPHILSTLGAAYAETGDFENAIKWSTKAVELGEKDLKDQVEQLKDELKHYEEGKPFRELQDIKEKPDPPARVIET